MSVVQDRNLESGGLWLDVPGVRTKQEYPHLPIWPHASLSGPEPQVVESKPNWWKF